MEAKKLRKITREKESIYLDTVFTQNTIADKKSMLVRI